LDELDKQALIATRKQLNEVIIGIILSVIKGPKVLLSVDLKFGQSCTKKIVNMASYREWQSKLI
jgi:hypothetical protein